MEEEEKEKEGKGFVVKDKRHFFQQEGERAPGEEKKEKKPRADEARLKAKEREKEAERREQREGERKEEGRQHQTIQISPPPEATFSVIVSLLAAQSLGILSEVSKLDKTEKDLHLQWARHFIDLISILKEKTKENLKEEERASIDHVLADLKMMYVKESG
jgi:hypothetical protein